MTDTVSDTIPPAIPPDDQTKEGPLGAPAPVPANAIEGFDPATGLVTTDVDGVVRAVPLQEMRANYQKYQTGAYHLQKATEKEKADVEKLALADDLLKMKGGGDGALDAFYRIGQNVYGKSRGELDQALQALRATTRQVAEDTAGVTGVTAGTAVDGGSPAPGDGLLLQPEHLPPATQELTKAFGAIQDATGVSPGKWVEQVTDFLSLSGNERAAEKINQTIDNDPRLAVYLGSRNDPQGTIRMDVHKDILRRASKDVPLDAVIKDVLDERRRLIESVAGTVTRSVPRASRVPGLPSVAGPGGVSAVQPTERPVFKAGENVEEYAHKVLTWNMAQSAS